MTTWAAFMASWFTPTSLFLLLNLVVATIVIISRFSASRNHTVQLAQAPSLIDSVKSVNFSLYKFPPPDSRTHLFPPSEAESTDPVNPPPLVRAPSLLDRVKSINFLNYKFHEYNPEDHFTQSAEPQSTSPLDPPLIAPAPSLLDRVKSINFLHYKFPQYNPETDFIQLSQREVDPPRLCRAPSLLERVKSINFSSFHRSERPETEKKFLPETEPNKQCTDPGTGKETEQNPRRRKSRGETAKMNKSASEKSRLGRSSEEEDAEMVERRRPTTARVDKTSSFGEDDHGVDAKADDFINRFKQQLKLQRLDSILRYKEMLKGK